MIRLTINSQRCKGCGLCVTYCSQSLLKLAENFNEAGYHPVEQSDPEQCTGCRLCVLICPEVCLELHRLPEKSDSHV